MLHETRTIEKLNWRPYFDSVSSRLSGQGVDITLSSIEGTVHQSRLWQLNGLTYDPHDDALIVSCRQQEHVISSPTDIRVEEEGARIASIEVSRKNGEREIIRFISPIAIARS